MLIWFGHNVHLHVSSPFKSVVDVIVTNNISVIVNTHVHYAAFVSSLDSVSDPSKFLSMIYMILEVQQGSLHINGLPSISKRPLIPVV